MKYRRLTNQKYDENIDLTQEYGYSYIYKRLYELEDKIEVGILIEPPVKLGQEVWYIPHYHGKPYCGVKKDFIRMIGFSSRGFQFRLRDAVDRQKTYMLGKSVFTTKEAADEQLKKEENTVKEN
jgi:hypothetical protein